MKIETSPGSLLEQNVDTLLIGVPQGNGIGSDLDDLNHSLDGKLAELLGQLGFNGAAGETALLPSFGKVSANRIVAVGLGNQADLTIDAVRAAWGAASRRARQAGARTIASIRPPSQFGASGLRAAVEGTKLGLYQHLQYRSESDSDRVIDSVVFSGVEDDQSLNQGVRTADAIMFARDLVNAPGIDLYPERLAGRAWEMAESRGLQCTVYDRAALEEMGAGAIVGVGQGSQREPRLIHLVYQPEGQSLGTAGFVGKAITFDTGGVNLKPPDGMRNMKMDMAGGAAVIGAMQAVADLKPPFTVHGVIAAAENMASHSSYRPGDVLRTLSGKTVEITNTDAEGRLVLADALTFTARQGADFMIDLATLTGASVVAVGNKAASLFGTDDDLVEDIQQAATFSGERMWRMPLWSDYRKDLDSDIADILNSGNRDGGAIKAALFLKEFTHNIPWAHLDIAGPAWSATEEGYRVKCGTGYGVHTLVSLLEQRARS
jgi:leucyl aminopeptidase